VADAARQRLGSELVGARDRYFGNVLSNVLRTTHAHNTVVRPQPTTLKIALRYCSSSTANHAQNRLAIFALDPSLGFAETNFLVASHVRSLPASAPTMDRTLQQSLGNQPWSLALSRAPQYFDPSE